MDDEASRARAQLHLRLAILSAMYLFAGLFTLGIVVGSAAFGMWSRSRIGAVITIALASGVALWQSVMYYRTEGLLHRGLGQRGESREESKE